MTIPEQKEHIFGPDETIRGRNEDIAELETRLRMARVLLEKLGVFIEKGVVIPEKEDRPKDHWGGPDELMGR